MIPSEKIPNNSRDLLVLGSVKVDLRSGTAAVNNATTTLTPKEVAVLRHLSDHPNQDVTREELYLTVWGSEESGGSRTLDTTVSRLRRKVEDNPSDPRFLRTVHGFGYRLCIDVETESGVFRKNILNTKVIGYRRQRKALREAIAEGQMVALIGPLGVGCSTVARHVVERGHGKVIEGSTPLQVLRAIRNHPHDTLLIDEVPIDEAVVQAILERQAATVVTPWRLVEVAHRTIELRGLDPVDGGELFLAAVPQRIRHQWRGEPARTLSQVLSGVPLVLIAAASVAIAYAPDELLKRLEISLEALHGPLCVQTTKKLQISWQRLQLHERALLLAATAFSGPMRVGHLAEVAEQGPIRGLPDLVRWGWLIAEDGRVSMPRHVRACILSFSDEEAAELCAQRHTSLMVGLAQQLHAPGTHPHDIGQHPDLSSDMLHAFNRAPDDLERQYLALAIHRLSVCPEQRQQVMRAVPVGTQTPLRNFVLLCQARDALEHLTADAANLFATGERLLKGESVSCWAEFRAIHAVWAAHRGTPDVAATILESLKGKPITAMGNAWACLAHGLVATALGQFRQASTHLREATVAASLEGDRALLQRCRISFAAALCYQGHGQQALEVVDDLLSETQLSRDTWTAVNARLSLAKALFLQGQFSESQGCFLQASAHAETAGNATARCAAEIGLTWVAISRGRLDRAVSMATLSTAHVTQHRNRLLQGMAEGSLALALHHQGQARNSAAEHYRTALTYLGDYHPRAAWAFRIYLALLLEDDAALGLMDRGMETAHPMRHTLNHARRRLAGQDSVAQDHWARVMPTSGPSSP